MDLGNGYDLIHRSSALPGLAQPSLHAEGNGYDRLYQPDERAPSAASSGAVFVCLRCNIQNVNAAVLAVEESLLAFWMMRGGGEEGDTSIAAFFRTASGLTWAPIGTARPTLGRELVNKELCDALAQKLEIDASEDGTNEKALQTHP